MENNGVAAPDTSDMHDEAVRMSTFTSWRPQWPVAPDQLARAGFYYIGPHDQVRCFKCGGGISNWEAGDDPLQEHRNFYPECSFVNSCIRDTQDITRQIGGLSGDITDSTQSDTVAHFPRQYNGPSQGNNRSEDPSLENRSNQAHPHAPPSVCDSIAKHPDQNIRRPAAISDRTETDTRARQPPTDQGSGEPTVNIANTRTQAGVNADATLVEHTSPVQILIERSSRLNINTAPLGAATGARPGLSPDLVESLMVSERNRLETLQHWPMKRVIDGRKVAAAGLYHTGYSDTLQCAFCRGALENWQRGDNPDEEHAHFFGDICPLILGRSTKNIPICELPYFPVPRRTHTQSPISAVRGTILQHAKWAQYANVESRKNSFERWQGGPQPTVADLVEAGFYFIGVDDNVRCYFCGGGLKAWLREDDPWHEHAKFYPECAYVLKVKGKEYIDGVKARELRVHMVTTPTVKEQREQNIDLRNHRLNRQPEQVSTPVQAVDSIRRRDTSSGTQGGTSHSDAVPLSDDASAQRDDQQNDNDASAADPTDAEGLAPDNEHQQKAVRDTSGSGMQVNGSYDIWASVQTSIGVSKGNNGTGDRKRENVHAGTVAEQKVACGGDGAQENATTETQPGSGQQAAQTAMDSGGQQNM